MKHFFIFLFIILIFQATVPAFGGNVFTDAVGRRVVIDKPPERIIPLAPSLTEIVYYLGLGDRVAGVTDFSYYPPEALEKPKIGSYVKLNVEQIITLSPDLVIGTKDGNNPGVVDLLEQAGITTFIVNPRNVIEIIETISIVGEICGIPEKGKELASGLKDRLHRVRCLVENRERPLVFLQINIRPIMTVNRNTFHHDIISLAGGINMSADSNITYPRISIEEVLRKRPDIIIISSMERGGMFEKAKQDWMKWQSIPAVRDGRVHLIDSDLIDRPSPRIVDGIEAMARIIHPDAWWDK